MEKAEDDTRAVAVAGLGWRVVYLLRKAPWVREVPVAAFAMENDLIAYPMVLDTYRTCVVRVRESAEYAIAAPGEPAAQFVDEAKERARAHRKWLRDTREQRMEEKRLQELVREMRRQQSEFEATSRLVPARHPAAALCERHRFVAWDAEQEAARLALVWFLVEHCDVRAGTEVSRAEFSRRFESFHGAYGLGGPTQAKLLAYLRQLRGVETLKYKGRVDGWSGLGLRDTVPDEACRPTDAEPVVETVRAAVGVFKEHCLRRAPSGTGGVPHSRMLIGFRAWCIGYRFRPLGSRDLIQALRGPLKLGKKDASGERVWEGVYLSMPQPGQRVLGRRPRR
jgi:hypothetical protein